MRSKLRSLLLISLIPTLITACADFQRGAYWDEDDEIGDGGDDTDSDGLYGYATDIHAPLDSGCERCHAPGNSAGSTNFLILSDDTDASYASTLDFVDLDAPAASRLLSKMAGKGHGGGTIYDDRSAEYDLVLAWIEQGAPP